MNRFAYKYEKEWDLYTIRKLDNSCLDYKIPNGLIRQLCIEETIRVGGTVIVANVERNIGYSSDGTLAVFDFNSRELNKHQIDDIKFAIENRTYDVPKKEGVLQRLKRKFTK